MLYIGATPGAAETYDRKIRELAARAELQKSLNEDKRERAERMAQTFPWKENITVWNELFKHKKKRGGD